MKIVSVCLVMATTATIVSGSCCRALAQGGKQVPFVPIDSYVDWKGEDIAPSKIGRLGEIAKDRSASSLAISRPQPVGEIANVASPNIVTAFSQPKDRDRSFVNTPFRITPSMLQFEIESSKIAGLGSMNRAQGSSLQAIAPVNQTGANGIAPQMPFEVQHKQ
jgi:hypothetical protein